jgi:hypothetical protein
MPTKVFWDKIKEIEIEMDGNYKQAVQQRKTFTEELTKEIQKEHDNQASVLDELISKFREDNKRSKESKIQRVKDLRAKFDSDDLQFKKEALFKLQNEYNHI